MRANTRTSLVGSPVRTRCMFRCIIVCLVGLFAGIGAADAQSRRQIDATPFSHAPCSVLDGQPCTPSFCSVFNDGPCIPEIDYPYGQNLQLTIESVPPQDQVAKYRKPDHDLDTIGDLFAALRSCWSPPAPDIARPGMQMSVRFSFKRSGEIIATPRVTYATAGAAADVRPALFKFFNNSPLGCGPLKFTRGPGGAGAGGPEADRLFGKNDLGKTSGEP